MASQKRVDITNGRTAFDGCPACGEPLSEYEPLTGTEMAAWIFDCGCSLYWAPDDGVEIGRSCPDAMNAVLEDIVFTVPDKPDAA